MEALVVMMYSGTSAILLNSDTMFYTSTSGTPVMNDIVVHPQTQVIYGMTSNSGNQLATLNPLTGEVTRFGTPGQPSFGALVLC